MPLHVPLGRGKASLKGSDFGTKNARPWRWRATRFSSEPTSDVEHKIYLDPRTKENSQVMCRRPVCSKTSRRFGLRREVVEPELEKRLPTIPDGSSQNKGSVFGTRWRGPVCPLSVANTVGCLVCHDQFERQYSNETISSMAGGINWAKPSRGLWHCPPSGAKHRSEPEVQSHESGCARFEYE